MLEVAALTAGWHVPSSRFRIRQHIPRLATVGVRVTEYCPPISKYAEIPGFGASVPFRYKFPLTGILWLCKVVASVPGVLGSYRNDVTWLSRDLVVGLPTLEPILKSPLVLDVDDAIWCTWPLGSASARMSARRSALVLAGNATLAGWFADYARRVEIVPTAVDVDRFVPITNSNPRATLTLGWIGSGSNLAYLQDIVPALAEVMRRRSEVRLRIVSNMAPRFSGLQGSRVDYVPWSTTGEVQAIQGMDIGLMPMPDNEWTRGKCSFKMLQYLACGKAAVVSPVGMNKEVLAQAEVGLGPRNRDEWVDALVALIDDAGERGRLGANGRQLVERCYAARVIADRIAGLLSTLT